MQTYEHAENDKNNGIYTVVSGQSVESVVCWLSVLQASWCQPRSAVYKMNKIGPSAETCRTLQSNEEPNNMLRSDGYTGYGSAEQI